MPAMLRNLLSVVMLSICLATSAQAVSPRAVKKFYQSLHKVLKSKQVQDKAGYTDLTPLHEFLQGKPLDKDMHNELAMFSDEYEDILKTKSKTEEIAVNIADLLKYSELQKTKTHDDLFDAAIKSLPAENKLYLFNIKLTLEDGTVVTLIKPGMSKNGDSRVKRQIRLLEGIANNLDDVTFTLPQKGTLKVKEMHVEQKNLAGRKKYLDLNFGVTDNDVHKHLQELGYQQVHGIPNMYGADKKEVLIKIADGKYEDSDHVQDVADMLGYANISTYRERRSATAIKKDNGISLNLGEYKTKLVFAQMKANASEFKDKNSELASILADIKWYEHATGNGKGLRPLYDEFAKQFSDADLERVERLSQEVYLMRGIISVVREGKENLPALARRLGLGNGYISKTHLEEGWEFDLNKLQAKIEEMRNDGNDYDFDTLDECMDILSKVHKPHKPKDINLLKQLEDSIITRATKLGIDDANKITEAKDLLHDSINKAGGWDELQKAFKTSNDKLVNAQSAGKFRYNLADAVLYGKDENQIVEAITFYRIIAVARRGGEDPRKVARRLGLGPDYSSKTHLNEGWEFNLDELQEKLAEMKDELGEDAIETIDDCIDRLRDLREPEQLNLPLAG